ncbi:MAG: heavy metal translocating P-type ATPase, partial [Pseudonocardia sp.]|nr:heavy metal translocating P-type ATPase [Pseudonocardia sp.]
MAVVDQRLDSPVSRRSRIGLRIWRDAPQVRWALLAGALFALGAIAQLLGTSPPLWWGLYLACYAAGGWMPASAGLRALREPTLDVDLLMIVAAIVAAAIGQVFDGALLIVIFATSGALESSMTRRTADSVRALLDLAPERATRVIGTGTEVVDTSVLAVGDVVLVRPGARIGADGRVLDGTGDVDQSSITGEPLPQVKRPGDEVFAGSLNGTGALRVRVDRPAGESVVARIAVLVERAARTKARTQLFIDKVESRYSIAVVATTLLLVALPLLWGAGFTETLLRAMTFMIVASPCALVLATMPPLLSAVANAGRHGVLVKSAVVMEKLGRTTIVAFDKTGTVTEGTPGVVAVTRIGMDAAGGPEPDTDAVLALAAAAEHDSEHPIGRAVLAAAHERGLQIPLATAFRSIPGEGVVATVRDRVVRVGSPALLARSPRAGIRDTAVAAIADFESDGHTALVVLIDEVPAAVIALADRARPGAREAVAALAALTGHMPVMLTGDNPRAAARLAAEIGITDVRAGLLPEDKLDQVTALQDDGHRVLLVGDGVNDAPAMAAAHAGIAMGRRGSDLTLDTADAVIVHDDLGTLPALVVISRRAGRVVLVEDAVPGGEL